MKIFDDERRCELLIRGLAAFGGLATLVLFVVATTKLVAVLQASTSSVSTLDTACGYVGGADRTW